MSDGYYATADDAARGLTLPLLLTAPAAAAVPRHGGRLAEHAPDTILGSRLFHRLKLTLDGAPRPVAIWVAGPSGTAEHLGWAIALAEHAARTGRTAYLVDLDRGQPLRAFAGGAGRPLPDTVLTRLAELGIPAAAAWATDLAGVRLVLPEKKSAEGPSTAGAEPWILILAQSLPEEGEAEWRPHPGIDGVILAAGIRDHTVSELSAAVRALRDTGHRLLGLVAMGPLPRREASPLERWEKAAVPPPVPASQPKAAATKPPPPATPLAAPAAAPAAAAPPPPPEDVTVVDTPLETDELTPAAPPVSLVAEWHRPERGKIRPWILVGAGVLVAAAAVVWFAAGNGKLADLLPWRVAQEEGAGTSIAEGEGGGGATEVGGGPGETGARSREAGGSVTPVPGDTLGMSRRSLPSESAGVALGPPAAADTAPVEAATAAPTTDSSAVAWADTFVIHVSSFRRASEADSEAVRLLRAGLPVRIVTVVLPERGRWHRVVVGAYPDSLAAAQEASRLRADSLVTFSQILGRGGRGSARRPTLR